MQGRLHKLKEWLSLRRPRSQLQSSPSSESRVALNGDILDLIGDLALDTKTLYSLCLTCRFWNAIFSVHLYREIDRNVDRIKPSNRNLVYTRSLIARTSVKTRENIACPCEDRFAVQQFNHVLRQIIPKLSNLERFVCPETFPLAPSTIQILRTSCPQLRSLEIHYCGLSPWPWCRSYEHNDTIVPLYCGAVEGGYDLSIFRNLETLALTELCGDLIKWRQRITTILLNSPNLKRLHLSLSQRIVLRAHQTLPYSPELFLQFWNLLCANYAEQGGQPLALRSLICGECIFPTNHELLAKLVDRRWLEEVRIKTTSSYWGIGPISYMFTQTPIIFDAFQPAYCPNLRAFSISSVVPGTMGLISEFAMDPAFSKKLKFHMGMDSRTASHIFRANPEYPCFPVVLRSLGELRIDSFERVGTSSPTYRLRVTPEGLDHILSSNAESLDGLELRFELPFRIWDIIRKGAPLMGQDVIEILESRLPRFRRLKYLIINFDDRSEQHWPVKTSDAGRRLHKEVEKMLRNLAQRAKQLEYACIAAHVWRVMRHKHDGRVQVDEVDLREWKHIEFFRHIAERRIARYWR